MYERFEECFGIVEDRCAKGAFLRLENGQNAFAYKFANISIGTRVLCTVLKTQQERILVSIDSVLEENLYSA